jgi:tRNA uridine 5-carboxymethylaminomethyl modification enzyme
VNDTRWDAFNRKRDAISREQERLTSTHVNPTSLRGELAENLLGKAIDREYSLMDLLRRPEVTYAALAQLPGVGELLTDRAAAEQVEIQAKYQGYIVRQRDEVARHQHFETLALPPDLDYRSVRGLSVEAQQKLTQHRPETVGQASRISGVTPAAISLLLVHLKRGLGGAKRSAA